MKTPTLHRPLAFITTDGQSYISTPEGPLYICGCGNDADHRHTEFDMAKEKYITRHYCSVCAQNLP